ncbi:MAG: hypothetical protein HKN19_01630 [Halioglobus sp.]|nr:hypothetical protein [Halioglobus sp.]
MKRKTEKQSNPHFRTDRMFEEGGQWYVRARGGSVMGPFANELDATNQLEIYIRQLEAGLLPSGQQTVLDANISVETAG